MKKLVPLISFLLTLHIASAQPPATVVKTQAMQMGQAMVKGDSKSFISFLPTAFSKDPKEGQKVMKLIDSGFAMFKAFGGQIKKVTYGQPSEIVRNGNTWQTALLQSTTVVSPIADAELQTVILAQSEDEGKRWTFIDLSLMKVNELKGHLPELNPKLALPRAAPPKISMKEQQH